MLFAPCLGRLTLLLWVWSGCNGNVGGLVRAPYIVGSWGSLYKLLGQVLNRSDLLDGRWLRKWTLDLSQMRVH